MSSRLGPFAVVRSKFVNTHIPERAVTLEPVIAATPDDPLAAPDPDRTRPLRLLPAPEPIEVTAEVPDGPPAVMVWRRVSYKFIKASGPERLGVEWWRSGDRLQLVPSEDHQQGQTVTSPASDALQPAYQEGAQSRDYYIAEDASGRRFWLFRQGLFGYATRLDWFMQGFFS
jgi:protein ImuB